MPSLATLSRLCADPAHLQVSRPGWLTHAVSLCSLIPHMQGGGPAQDRQSGLLVLRSTSGVRVLMCVPLPGPCVILPHHRSSTLRGGVPQNTHSEPTPPSSVHQRTEEACLLGENREIYRSKCLNDRREEKENVEQTSYSEVPGPALFLQFSY